MKRVAQPEKVWQRTRTPNLIKHGPSGIYYLRARVGKKNAIRESLRTDVYSTAQDLLRRRMGELALMRPPRHGNSPKTLREALLIVRARIDQNPALKPMARRTYFHMLDLMEKRLPDTPLHKLTSEEMEQWWKATADKYAPATANFHRLLMKRALVIAREYGAVGRNLGANLHRLKVPRTRLNLITKEQFAALVAEVAKQPYGKPAAEWIEFVAYTGCRPEEANAVRWEDLGESSLTITGGAKGTKNHEARTIPIVPALKDLLERIRKRTGATSGRVLTMKGPRALLATACKELNIPRLRRYDFRHLFASRCNEAGVDAATFSRWLGHKDGGALALRTYVHIHDEHDARSAARVKF